MKKRWFTAGRIDLIFFIALFLLCLYLAFDINNPGGKPRGAGEFYSDKAAYYVYLPATFIYGWDIHKFPEKIDEKTQGFTLQFASGKLMIKTTCGVALLWMPFFLLTHLIAVLFGLQPDGFSLFYQQMTVLPAVFYLVLGLFFLKKFLDNYFSGLIPYLAVILVFTGTNLYYFSLNEGLMSHVNSFFLFSCYLYLLKKFLDGGKKIFSIFVLISIVLSLSILIRFTNALLLSWLIFLDARSFKEIGKRILFFLNPRYSLTFIVICFLVFIPQFIYWKYLSGNFFYYSYPGESFANWKHPMIIGSWFAPLNGLFLYNPLVLLFITGIVIMIVKKIPNGIFTGLFFLFISYMYSSWHSWYFGGSYGARQYIEFYSLLALPFGYFLQSVHTIKNLFARTLLVILIVASTYYNLRLLYNYGWFSSSTWAWDDFLLQLDNAGIYHFPKKTYHYVDDFENITPFTKVWPTRDCVHSQTYGSYCVESMEFNCRYSRPLDGILDNPVRKVTVSVWINPLNIDKTGALFVCSIEDSTHTSHFYKTLKADDFVSKANQWAEVSGTFYIPEWINRKNWITLYVWNCQRKNFYLDDLSIKFE